MSFEIINSVLTIKLDNIATMTLAAILLLIGIAVRKRRLIWLWFCPV